MVGGTKRARGAPAAASPPVTPSIPLADSPPSPPSSRTPETKDSSVTLADSDSDPPPVRKSPMQVYQEILVSGYYDQLVKVIDKLGTRALVNNVYGEPTAKVPGTFVRRTGWKTGYTYESSKPGERGRDLRVVVVGEVCSLEEGTRLSAIGCHWPGSMSYGNNYITNGTSVKDGYLLRNITLAHKHQKMGDIFADTFVPLYQAKKIDDEADLKAGKTYDVKHCVVGAEVANEGKFLSLHSKRKYVPSSKNGAANALGGTMRAQERRDALEKAKDKVQKMDASGFPSPPYTVGQLYDPALLPDFNGNALFQNFTQRLIQQDYRYSDGSLIPPWQMYEALRPGTLVMATVTPTVFLMGDSKDEPVDVEYRSAGKGDRKKKTPLKVYQLIIESLKILAESGEDIEERTPHPGFNSDLDDPADLYKDEVDPLDEVASFKRPKLRHSGTSLEGYSVSSGGSVPVLAHQGSSGLNGDIEDMDVA